MRLLGKPRTRHRPRSPQPGPVDQTACLSETPVAFAGAGRASTETAIAFADENWVFLARFSAALALSVSMVAVQGRALVMVVSRWPASVAVEVSLVASSPRGCVPRAKKFALRTKNGPKLVFYGALGELLRGNAAGGAALGEFFRGSAVVGSRRASLLRRGPGSWALLLAVLTLQCAAKPTWWPMGSTAHAPLGGLKCA